MTDLGGEIVRSALAASTPNEARAVQSMLASTIGASHERPIGDKWNNHGLMGSAGSFDIKLIEAITNMQDAVIERKALARWGAPSAIPYDSPHSAAQDLLGSLSTRERAEQATVTFKECTDSQAATELAAHTKRLTAVFRDSGCGLTPVSIPSTIFGLGGSHKEAALYLQGAFGMGGALTYRNAEAVVLVTRRDPELLVPGEQDVISVAVVEWRENVKGRTAYYLVDQPWNEPGDRAYPWSVDAHVFPEFGPGTHLALIGYRVEGFHRRREGDERSFDVVANTRLFRPVTPILFTNETTRSRRTTLQGLDHRLERSEHDFSSGFETLPFTHNGDVYLLPVSYVLFSKPREPGGRDKFVARDHAVLFTSNGQVHHHWTPAEFRNRTGLNKIYDRVLVVIETDELPIRVRTSLFTADRNDLVRGDAALRLEDDVAGFIRDWDALRDENNALLRESLRGSNDRSTAEVAKRISRALSVRGFAFSGGSGASGSGTGRGRAGGGGGSSKPIPLFPDPTRLEGPSLIQAEIGRTRAVSYVVDVVDSFYDGRGHLKVTCDHEELRQGTEITVGKGRSGRVRVMVAVPDTLEPGSYQLEVVLEDWHRASGGIGPRLEWVTKLELVDEIAGRGSGAGKRTTAGRGNGGPSEGSQVALKWSSPEHQDGWERITVGEVESIPAHVLASERDEYAELMALGSAEIPTVVLNEEYPPLKKYLESRNRELTNVERPREQYATGIGVALLMLDQAEQKKREDDPSHSLDPDVRAASQRAAAAAVLAVMPAFDELAREAGLEA